MAEEEIAAKKPKMLEDTIEEANSIINQTNVERKPNTCAFFVKRKKRYCKMTVGKGKEFCGEHEPLSMSKHETAAAECCERIPCPLDPKHSIYKHKLHKHLKICNAKIKEDQAAYIVKNINAGEELENTKEDFSKLKINELSDDEFYDLVKIIKDLYNKYLEGQIQQLQEQHKSLEMELAQLEDGKEAKKHLLQTAALLGILEKENQLADNTSFIEFGAGKGQLAFYVAQLLQKQQKENSQVLLIDRMSLRHKKDNKIEDKSLVHRIRADIADLNLNLMELLQKTSKHVAISKHLCGVATDLSLRCLSASKNPSNFIMIALCCHHRCEWPSFVGKAFFEQHNINAKQFTIFTKMASWAVCGTGMSRERRKALEEQALTAQEIEKIKADQRLNLKEREEIGFMCKRLLDYARVDYLRKQNYEATLNYYIAKDITLENVCLIAKKVQ